MEIKITPRKLIGTIEAMPSKSHAHRLLIARKLSEMQGGALEGGIDIPAFSDDIALSNCLSLTYGKLGHMPIFYLRPVLCGDCDIFPVSAGVFSRRSNGSVYSGI